MASSSEQKSAPPRSEDEAPAPQPSANFTSLHLARAFALAWIAVVILLWLFGAKNAHGNQFFAMTVTAYLACWAPFFAVSLYSRRQKAIRFVTASGSLLVVLAVLELVAALGWADFRRVLGNRVPPWEDTRNLLDPELVHIRRPHYHERGKLIGGDLNLYYNTPAITTIAYDVKYDHNGFRNDVDYDQADCVVIGDSFVEAGGVFAEDIFTTKIAEALGVSVVNLGQSHYGPQQELKVLERFAVPLKPRICVWVFFEANDLQDVWRYQQFVDHWPQSVAKYSSWKERSLTVNTCAWLAKRFAPVAPSDGRNRLGHLPTSRGEQKIWFGYEGKPFTPEMVQDVEGLKVTLAAISSAHALCKQNDIQFVVAFAPTKYRVYADVCRFEKDSPIQGWVVNTLPAILTNSIRKYSSEIGFLDLTTELNRAAKNGQMLYYPDDTHWSPEGHEVVGRTISEFLTSEFGELLD